MTIIRLVDYSWRIEENGLAVGIAVLQRRNEIGVPARHGCL